jgi:hypothetical protein
MKQHRFDKDFKAIVESVDQILSEGDPYKGVGEFVKMWKKNYKKDSWDAINYILKSPVRFGDPFVK